MTVPRTGDPVAAQGRQHGQELLRRAGTAGKPPPPDAVRRTGAGSGMGEADAVLLAAGGAKVVLGDLRPDRLEAVASRIAADGEAVA